MAGRSVHRNRAWPRRSSLVGGRADWRRLVHFMVTPATVSVHFNGRNLPVANTDADPEHFVLQLQ
jgi:hypothetical protein